MENQVGEWISCACDNHRAGWNSWARVSSAKPETRVHMWWSGHDAILVGGAREENVPECSIGQNRGCMWLRTCIVTTSLSMISNEINPHHITCFTFYLSCRMIIFLNLTFRLFVRKQMTVSGREIQLYLTPTVITLMYIIMCNLAR